MKAEYAANFIMGYESLLLKEWSKEGATVESIEHKYLSSFQMPVPPLSEQQSIIDLISDRMIVFEKLEAQTLNAIKLLQERRTAIISAAVTGKIDVRNWQSPTDKDIQ